MYTFSDNTYLLASQLNNNFALALDRTSVTLQTVASPLQLNGNVGAVNIALTGTLTSAAEARGTTVVSTAGNYVATATDRYVLVNKTIDAVTTVTLPSNAVVGRVISVKDMKGTSSSYTITVVASGSDLIDGNTTRAINYNYSSVDFLYNGVTGWSIV